MTSVQLQPMLLRSFVPAGGTIGGLAEGPLPRPASALGPFAPERASHRPGQTRHSRRRGAPHTPWAP
jgi:hypothetical protein